MVMFVFCGDIEVESRCTATVSVSGELIDDIDEISKNPDSLRPATSGCLTLHGEVLLGVELAKG